MIVHCYIFYLFTQGDKELLYSLKALQNNMHPPSNNSGGGGGPPRLRGKPSMTRPRPKTIHIDNHSSTSDMHDGILTPSRGNKGSSSNLSGEPFHNDLCLRYVNFCIPCMYTGFKYFSLSKINSILLLFSALSLLNFSLVLC